jgi:hypothetical protein
MCLALTLGTRWFLSTPPSIYGKLSGWGPNPVLTDVFYIASMTNGH